jgi:hypothetical protein
MNYLLFVCIKYGPKKITAFWNIASSSLGVDRLYRGAYRLHHTALMMEEVRTSETSVYSNETTRRYIPEGCNLHTRRREKLN